MDAMEANEGEETSEGSRGRADAKAAARSTRWNSLRRASHAMHAWSEAGRRGRARRVELFPDREDPVADAGFSAEELDAEMWDRLGGGEHEAARRPSVPAGRMRGLIDWMRSEEGFRLMLASITLLLLCVLRLRRLSPDDPLAMLLNDITGRLQRNYPPIDLTNRSLVQAGEEDFLLVGVACRWDWGVTGCVERAAGTLAEGVVCAFKPLATNWLRCRPSNATLVPLRASCPAHCRAPKPPSCTASAASVLYRVAETLRQETDAGELLPPGRA